MSREVAMPEILDFQKSARAEGWLSMALNPETEP
jgi:hypothetical protein